MSGRQYDQFCGIAVALDAVGERWTLLIVRDLLVAPARFSELLESLSGISPNMLAERLKTLQALQLIEQHAVADDARGRKYALTERGEGLRGPILQLARWGMGLMTEKHAAATSARAEWAFLAIESMAYGRTLARDVSETYQFCVSGTTFCLRVVEGVPDLRDISAPRESDPSPAVKITTNTRTFIRIGAGLLHPFLALAQGEVEMDGDLAAFERCADLLGLIQIHSLSPGGGSGALA